MFRQLATALAAGPPVQNSTSAANTVLTDYRPSQLSEFLETVWNLGRNADRQAALGKDLVAADHQAMARPDLLDPLPPAQRNPPAPAPPVTWHHLVYAALLEQTRITDIFRRVVYEWVHGERLPTATQDSQRWLHTTEQLFFNNAWSYSVRSVTSNVRPDASAVRRNAYWRMFAWDLQHGTDDGKPYPYVRAEAANRDFTLFFEALLTEVWRGFVNVFNFIGPNETDLNAIDTLVRRLQEMLQTRRLSGALSREEFDAVAMASWFHLTVEFDTQVVVDLNAKADGIADRLRRIGERVGLPPHSRTDAFFQLAVPMSNILTAIESGTVSAAGPTSLFTAAQFTGDMLQIITHWAVATGRNVKDPSQRQPLGNVLTQPRGGFDHRARAEVRVGVALIPGRRDRG